MESEKSSERGEKRRSRRESSTFAILIAAIGGTITATILAFALGSEAPEAVAAESGLSVVAPAAIAAAAETLEENMANRLAEEARKCSAPLAYLTISSPAAVPSEPIRIRSGSYLSPRFVITNTPQRIAIPFPSPYPTGRGVISIVGDTKALDISLFPTWHANSVVGGASRNVTWTTDKPC